MATDSFIGASSDVIVNGEKEHGCLEVKSPFSIDGVSVNNMPPVEIACSFKQFFLEQGESGLLELKRHHPCYSQVQRELAVPGLQWCDFVVFTDCGLFVEQIHFHDKHWEDVIICYLAFATLHTSCHA